MAKGRRFTSHDAVSTAGTGISRKTRQHTVIGLWVEATNFDPTNDSLTVRAEVSPDDTHYSPINHGAPAIDDALSISGSDLVESDQDASVHVAYKVLSNVSVEHVRANITTFTDNAGGDLSVTTYIYLGGWTGRGKSFNEREDTPTRV